MREGAVIDVVASALAVVCFGAAAVVDWPWPGPSRQDRRYGNFFCSLGWWCLAVAFLARATT